MCGRTVRLATDGMWEALGLRSEEAERPRCHDWTWLIIVPVDRLDQENKSRRPIRENPWMIAIIGGAIATILAAAAIGVWKGITSQGPIPPSPTPSPDNGPTPPPQAIRWQGTVTINQQGVELDAIPPSYSGSPTLFFLLGAGKTVEAGGGAFMANWTGFSAPTHSECQNQLQTSNVGVVDVFEGQGICVETQEKHIAYVRVTSVSSNSVGAQVTVWN